MKRWYCVALALALGCIALIVACSNSPFDFLTSDTIETGTYAAIDDQGDTVVSIYASPPPPASDTATKLFSEYVKAGIGIDGSRELIGWVVPEQLQHFIMECGLIHDPNGSFDRVSPTAVRLLPVLTEEQNWSNTDVAIRIVVQHIDRDTIAVMICDDSHNITLPFFCLAEDLRNTLATHFELRP